MLLNSAKASITFKAKTYTKSDGSQISFDDIKLYSVLLSVSQNKNIVKTQRTGANGTVKEYIGMDDYKIAIEGVLTGTNGNPPSTSFNVSGTSVVVSDVIALRRMLECPVAIDVVNSHLQNFGIYQVVVDSYEFPEEAGGVSYQNFRIDLSSTTPVELKILST